MPTFKINDFQRENVTLSAMDDYDLVTYSVYGGKLTSNSLFNKIEPGDSFLCIDIENTIDRSQNLLFEFEDKNHNVFSVRMGLLPHIRTTMNIPFSLFDGKTVFVHRTPGVLKTVVNGKRINICDIISFSICVKISLMKEDTIEKTFKIYNIHTDSKPSDTKIEPKPIVDEFGQWNEKDWKGKIHTFDELKQSQNTLFSGSIENRSKYGGYLKKQFGSTGFFRIEKDENSKYWMVDPDGFAFISMGMDCVLCEISEKVDGLEKLHESLPEQEQFYKYSKNELSNGKYVNLLAYNLYRVFGESYYEKWISITKNRLQGIGINTVGNWSDREFCSRSKIPYVIPLNGFPKTSNNIFRDFPDVFSDEYKNNSEKFSSQMEAYKDDKYLIGYFMSNEPLWAWAPDLNLAEEMLISDIEFKSKDKFIEYIKNKYTEIDRLNCEWGSSFRCFDDFKNPIKNIHEYNNKTDLNEFSKMMMYEYVRIPSLALKKVDENHLNLGMRYAGWTNDNIVIGSEFIDAFSFNCYSGDATDRLRQVADHIDKPCIIGEFHFGAFDRGLSMTGIISVESQEERGVAYRYYMENSVLEPNFLGAHYFTLYDQAYLGRFDGENYQIGICDICNNEYSEMTDAIKATAEVIYDVALGNKKPYSRKPKIIAR